MAQVTHNTSQAQSESGSTHLTRSDTIRTCTALVDSTSANAESALCAPGELKIADLSAGPGLTDRYDQVLLSLCNTEALTPTDLLGDGPTRFCHHVRHALTADTAYLCNRTSLSIVATSSVNSAYESCEDTLELHSALTTMISDLWNCEAPLCPPAIKVFPDQACFSYSIIPLDTQHDHLLVITNAGIDQALIGDYLADALTAIYNGFLQNTGTVPASSDSEPPVLDKLQSKYRISSKLITTRRLERFQYQLKQHAVKFEGISLASRKTKTSALSTTLPESLYETAHLWNDKFSTSLDCHALVESAYGHKALCENENLLKFSDSRSLKVRVHAQSLSNPDYIDTLRELTEKSAIHASLLIFSVIPQAGKSYADALNCLHEKFGIPQPPAAQPEIQPADARPGIADEFDPMQINGVAVQTTIKQA